MGVHKRNRKIRKHQKVDIFISSILISNEWQMLNDDIELAT